jgi:hypothetical protein
MPYKANARTPSRARCVTNWAEYDAALPIAEGPQTTMAGSLCEITTAVEILHRVPDLERQNSIRVASASAQKVTFSVFLISAQHAGA